MGELVRQVRGDEQKSQRSSLKWNRQGQDVVEGEMPRKEATTPAVNREAVRQESWNKQMLNPTLALAEALRRAEVWDDGGLFDGRRKQDMNWGRLSSST